MTQDQLYLATTYFKKRIANRHETPTKDVDIQITPEGIKLVYEGDYKTYIAFADETKGEFFRDFNVIVNYDKMPFAPEDND